MEKIKVWNWQRIHGENASSQGWVYRLLMSKRITVIENDAVKILDGKNTGDIANVGDYLVYFSPPRQDFEEIRAVSKEDFESNYERMT